jgi:amino acid transporter/mannitol/fructose-specific phosphotransferase system IIA component (Ntr-type)
MSKENPELKKELNTLEVFSISSGAMISSGLFILPSIVFLKAGPSIILSYIFAALVVIPAMLSKAELATAMPKAGGVYFFVHRSLGPLFGTFTGFASWFALSLKSAFALVGIGIFLEPLFPGVSIGTVKLIAIGFTVFFTILNIFSVKKSGRFQVILLFGLIAILVFYIFSGLNYIDVQRYVPFKPYGWKSILTVTGMIFISFGGLTKIASIAEEVKDPAKTIPRGMFSAFAVVVLLYVLTIFVTVGVLDNAEFRNTLTPLSTGAARYMGNIGYIILSLAAMLAFITTANGGLMAASRNPLAMSKDNLLPAFFSRVNLRFKTPAVSVLMTAFFMTLVISFLDIESLVKVASTMKLILFSFVNISVILMRESKIVSYKPAFKAPLYPYLQIAGVAVYLALIIEMGIVPLLITSGLFILSLAWYLLYSKSRSSKDSALIHIAERITAKDIESSTLRDELRGILLERDEIIEDRFDRIIKGARIVDLDGDHDVKSLFNVLSKTFAEIFNIPPNTVCDLLIKREAETTTVIHTGLAIPHIIIEGNEKFDIVIARSQSGIDFLIDNPPVHIVFALAGTKDERNFHLQALMAIAQIVQNKDFTNNWMKVRDPEDLRNLILLAQRVRKDEV